MPQKRRQRRIPAQETSDEGASDECASKKVDQWVVGIVAGARDGDGNEYYLVRWGADDKGKPFDVGMEEETWEPSAHVQGCPDALNKFYEASRPPLPSEKDAMESEMLCSARSRSSRRPGRPPRVRQGRVPGFRPTRGQTSSPPCIRWLA